MSRRWMSTLLVALVGGATLAVTPAAGAAPPPAAPAPAAPAPADVTASLPDTLERSGPTALLAPREGRPLSGSFEQDGHAITWAVAGAEACPAAVLAVQPDCSGVVRPGVKVTLTASASFTIGEGAVTNLSQGAQLSLTGAPSQSQSFSERVGGGTYAHSWTLAITSPVSSADATKPAGSVLGYGSASVHSRNCNDWGVCGGPTAEVRLVLVNSSSAQDTTKPLVRVTPHTGIVTKYPLSLRVDASDNKGKIKLHGTLYSGGQKVGGADTSGFTTGGRFSYNIRSAPSGKGPYFVCVWAEDQAGNRSQGAPKSSCTWLSIAVPVSRVSNGCGTGEYGAMAEWLQNYFGNDRYYGRGEYRVQVKAACDMHDAGYAGVTAYDPFLKKYVDFRTWTRARVDAKFKADIQAKCRSWLTLPSELPYRTPCQGGLSIGQAVAYFTAFGWTALQDKVGANVYYEAVRKYGGVGYDANATVPGIQTTVPSRTLPAGGGRSNA